MYANPRNWLILQPTRAAFRGFNKQVFLARGRLGGIVDSSELSAEAHRSALKHKLAGIRGKLTVVEREIAEIQAQEKPPTDNPGLFGQHSPFHHGLRALQEHRRQLERVVEKLEEELRGK